MLAIIFASVCATIVSASIDVCSSSNALVKDLNVSTSPENPVIGQDYTLTLDFTSPVGITEGSKQKIKMTFDGFPVSNDEVSLCDELVKNNIDCPVAAGHHTMSWSATIPTDIPSGELRGSQAWYTESGEELFCFKFTFDV